MRRSRHCPGHAKRIEAKSVTDSIATNTDTSCTRACAWIQRAYAQLAHTHATDMCTHTHAIVDVSVTVVRACVCVYWHCFSSQHPPALFAKVLIAKIWYLACILLAVAWSYFNWCWRRLRGGLDFNFHPEHGRLSAWWELQCRQCPKCLRDEAEDEDPWRTAFCATCLANP